MKNLFLRLILIVNTIIILGEVFSPGKTLADGGCVPVYGGGVECPKAGQVLVDKKVRNPASGVFVDNLGLYDPKYLPEQIVTFQITVKNSGDETISNLQVVDTLPQFVDYMSGPGSYDNTSRKLSFNVSNLGAGISQVFQIKGRVSHQAALPEEKSTICPVNVVDASFGSQKDHDESQFCVEKQINVPTVPKAGPEHWVFSLAGLGIVFSLGNYLRKKTLAF
uniref:DUF11 domain-containing protein n=1 Tax=candidate division CPR3 bacterium TaxID=2268181 RepID=A0A7C4RAN2_UNCC3